MKIPKNISWNEFLERIKSPSRADQESCAWIFIDVPKYVWNILEVKNVGLKGMSVKGSFGPDKKDFARVKRLAKKLKLTKIGNVHTHVVISKEFSRELLMSQMRPSEADLKYAKKFNDIVRCIIVVWFKNRREKGEIFGMIWHDKYGKIFTGMIDL